MSLLGTLLKPVFDVTPDHLPPPAAGDGAAARRLQQVVYTVTECCETTLRTPRFARLVALLDDYPEELRGFAYEGAGVALAALDQLTPWTCRTRAFADGPAAPYRYAVYLGAGMGLARIRRNPEGLRRRLGDDLFNWVVLDGYGFHEGFFAYRRHIQEQSLPPAITGYRARAFDHGLGRSIWFASGADPDLISRSIDAFPVGRRGDLWAGIGLACGYTGGVAADDLERLRGRAAAHRARLAEGVVVAAKNRHQVGNPAAHNDLAAEGICGMTSAQAAAMAEAALEHLPDDDVVPAYEVWRGRLRQPFQHIDTGPAVPAALIAGGAR